MIYYLILGICFLLTASVIKFYRNIFYLLARNSVALVNNLIAEEEDEIKIKQVQYGTQKLVVSLLKMFVLIFAAFAIGSLPMIAYCFIADISYNSLNMSSLTSIIAISVGATIPFIIPSSKKKHEGYSELSILLHHLALDNYSIANKLLSLETKKTKKKGINIKEDFVIISGLARAGTTSLMNNLSEYKEFTTLNYSNMPFLMCPNIWKRFYNPKSNNVKERSHKDGIMIGLNSNEALEEYFFKVKANDSYINKNSLNEYLLSEQDYIEYLDYQSNIRQDNSKTYLAKNNNFILRYNSVRKYNDKFIMVILYRDPLTHAASLLEKHKYYSKLQNDDNFVLEYMNWLGHHEFGLNQKQFLFGSSELINGDKNSLDYWLKIWINYYSFVSELNHKNTILINYDSFCNDPSKVINRILQMSHIEVSPIEFKAFTNKRKSEFLYTQDIYNKAINIFKNLENKQT